MARITILNRLNQLENRISRFIRFYFQKHQLGYFALFRSFLTHSELESYTVFFFFFFFFFGGGGGGGGGGSLLCEECSNKI